MTLVLGASAKPDRYSYLAVQRLLEKGHAVCAVGVREGRIADQAIVTTIPEGRSFHTVTMYLNAFNQRVWQERILALRPQRIIFNPGAENKELSGAAEGMGIEVVEGCTLVMLSAGTY
ncbi:MAG: CoA-binding protein [Flavobacteriales bacterium]|nr:CoA-binding protein [Flavobacteriales bacterium]